MRTLFTAFFATVFFAAHAQRKDSTVLLSEVEVKAFAYERPLAEVPATIAVLQEKELNRFSNTSILPAVNRVPGVRMEERSPGSYRFAIRGSSLRSPFGVRNVKFYWRGLPLTDGGGNTYLNVLDFNAIGSLEIIKGPGASTYGAGTGGVVLLEPPTTDSRIDLTAGSYGLFRMNGMATVVNTDKSVVGIQAGYQKSDGYRQQSAMQRLGVQLNWDATLGHKGHLATTFLTSRLHYETPGGLTQQQYEEDPRQARPGAGAFRSAVDQQAAVTNKTHYLGSLYTHDWSQNWHSSVGLFASLTDFENPTIRNYETRAEKNAGFRASTSFRKKYGSIVFKTTGGLEAQWFGSILKVNGNQLGQRTDQVFGNDELNSSQRLIFLQTDFDLPHQFLLTAGISNNHLLYRDINRLKDGLVLERRFATQWAPRVALHKRLNDHLALKASASRGFSPPTFSEAVPSLGGFNQSLNPEWGTNRELGLTARGFGLQLELTRYWFGLYDAIVIQRAPDGADYFVNAGRTRQNGWEAALSFVPENRKAPVEAWLSYAYTPYRFDQYTSSSIDYSGNQLTGTPTSQWAAGVDWRLANGFYLKGTGFWVDEIPLDDANSAFSSHYVLLGLRTGAQKKIFGQQMELFAGVDNLLDARYSLGNDLNAVGARFYNAAPPRNYYLGLSIRHIRK